MFSPLANSAMFIFQWTLIQVIYASAHAGEASKHIITHCLAAFAAMGKPQQLKTDNGPAYISAAFQWFCET
jgi:hypothetical protein